MSSSSRITDQWFGICCCPPHSPPCIPMGGIIITGSPNARSLNLNQARMTDITIGWCGHVGMIISSSILSKTNSLGKARVGSQVIGCNLGIVITGAPTHEVGG